MAIPKNFSAHVFLQLMLTLICIIEVGKAKSLTYGFYKETCPEVEAIVAKTVKQYISRVPTLAAPLLRMHFHDCFVRGCDGSILINSTPNNTAEKDGIPNLSLRGYNIIDIVKSALEKKCPNAVSCADILALVTRDAVMTIGGPFWPVPTGRRDGRISLASETLQNLLPGFANITQLKAGFAAKGLSVKDLVVLSGGHTIGTSLCSSFSNRLYNFSGKGDSDSDPTLDKQYVANLRKKCPKGDQRRFVEMDPGSFKTFDEDYYVLVSKRRGLFESDSALLNDPETKAYVQKQVSTKGSTFAADFAESMVTMGQIGVLTGTDGEIRKHCAFVN